VKLFGHFFCLLLPFVALTLAADAGNSPTSMTVNAIDLMPQGRASDERGIMTDAIMDALKRAGLTGHLQFHPWVRAQQETMEGKNILITALSRTPEREYKYTWIFPVFKYERCFVTLKQKYDTFEKARSIIKQVAVTRGSAQYDILIRRGFVKSQIQEISVERQSIIPSLLLNQRVDAWFVAIVEVKFAIRNLPDVSKFVIGPPIGDYTEQYVACSKNCSQELVAKLRKAARQMREDGSMAAIINRYQ
jgi:polar amino acid transport system substrate-binding protein